MYLLWVVGYIEIDLEGSRVVGLCIAAIGGEECGSPASLATSEGTCALEATDSLPIPL